MPHLCEGFQWLPLGSEIQYRSLCAMHHYYFHPQHVLVVPPVKLGCQHQYVTRTTQIFAQPPRCRLAFTQRFFRFKAIHWWNALPNDILTSATFKDVF